MGSYLKASEIMINEAKETMADSMTFLMTMVEMGYDESDYRAA